MRSRQPLLRRIVIAFVLMTTLVSGAFSLGIVTIVHLIEEHLVSEEMHLQLQTVLQEDLRNQHPPRLGPTTRFYASGLGGYAIPDEYTELNEGFTEVVRGDQAFYAYTRIINDERFMLVQEQSEFEAREKALFNVVLAGFLLSVVGAWGLGWLMARRVMTPVSRLARQVSHHDQLHPLAPPLAPEYADDEVGQLAAAFDSTLGQLRHSLERERLFTSDVSHELRTPLMVIASSCELLAQGQLDPRQRAQLARVERASEEMRDLVQIFLQLARSKTNTSVFAASCSLQQVAEEQLAHWGPQMRERELAFELICEGQDLGMYNPILLRTVMANLLRNALHYTDQGHVRLVVERGGFRVEDSGMGIAPQQQEQIFQPFVRGERARGEGMGLGLSLVKRICSDQGWAISIRELEPGGSSFHVVLGA
jgi:signal transduction histidine kinase